MTATQAAYRVYLQSEHWRGLRLEAFKRYGRKCSKCPATCRLDVHHVRYRHPWTAGIVDDLMILCRRCHELEHGLVVVIPVIDKRLAQKKRRKNFRKWRSRQRKKRRWLAERKRPSAAARAARLMFLAKRYRKYGY